MNYISQNTQSKLVSNGIGISKVQLEVNQTNSYLVRLSKNIQLSKIHKYSGIRSTCWNNRSLQNGEWPAPCYWAISRSPNEWRSLGWLRRGWGCACCQCSPLGSQSASPRPRVDWLWLGTTKLAVPAHKRAISYCQFTHAGTLLTWALVINEACLALFVSQKQGLLAA